MATNPLRLPPFNENDTETLHAIIDTPKGSRNKFKWDEKHELYKLSGVLTVGAFFPYDFGFVPSTLADDGDPIDVLVLMDEPVFVGCLVPSRLIGGFYAKQTESGKTERNDRLLAVAANSRNHHNVRMLDDLRTRTSFTRSSTSLYRTTPLKAKRLRHKSVSDQTKPVG